MIPLTQAHLVALYDAVTGERIARTQSPVITEADRKAAKGWVLRYRSAYARRTGNQLTMVREPVQPPPVACECGSSAHSD